MRRTFQDHIGKTFGRLTVLSYKGWINKHARWICKCSCGNVTEATSCNLTRGHTRSCGCLTEELWEERRKQRWKKQLREFNSWHGMIARCTNPNNPQFFNYGMRGITVCERWLHSFENFLSDMGRKPTPKHSLDRKDNSKGYSPENCRWATSKEQCYNTRRNRWLEHDGIRMTITEWAKKLGIPQTTFHSQLKTRTLSQIIESR